MTLYCPPVWCDQSGGALAPLFALIKSDWYELLWYLRLAVVCIGANRYTNNLLRAPGSGRIKRGTSASSKTVVWSGNTTCVATLGVNAELSSGQGVLYVPFERYQIWFLDRV